MKTRGLLIGSLVLAGALALLGWIVAAGLPPGAELPTHWNAAGEVDRTMPPGRALSIAPVLIVLVSALCAAIPRLEPLQDRLADSAAVHRTAWIGVLAVLTVMHLMIVGPALGFELGLDPLVVATGALLVALGNILPKSRPSFFVGARTPWALADPDNWGATQRLAGKTMIVAGGLIILGGLLPIAPLAKTATMVIAVLANVVVPFAYSWWLWRSRKATGQ